MPKRPYQPTARLTVTCDDQPGIVAAVTGFFHRHKVNITALDQHATAPEGGQFFMRLELHAPHLSSDHQALEAEFQREVSEPLQMQWRLSYLSNRKSMVLMASRQDHALLELLWRWKRGELPVDIAMVVSNHPDLEPAVTDFGIRFHHVPVTAETRAEGEQRLLGLINPSVDLVVLARYMQILSPAVVDRFPGRIINIHHSFLPAFVGANPYQRAFDRGVKLIGATAHYVTSELDAGPIIEQNVVRVSHRQSATEMKILGQDIERQVLARAVRWHLEDRVIVHDNRTIVFN